MRDSLAARQPCERRCLTRARDAGARSAARRSPLAAWLIVVTAGLAAGCGEPEATADAGAGAADTEQQVGFGQTCERNSQCPTALFCMQSEASPTPWCTRFCDSAAGENPKGFCQPDTLGGHKALCVKMPDDFAGPTKPFCTPSCDTLNDCTALDPMWEKCDKPSYKNLYLDPELPSKSCQAPSARGRIQVDPLTCAWEAKVTEPQLQEAKGICKSWCTFLTTCQHFDTKHKPLACCTWACFQDLVTAGHIDTAKKDRYRCYDDAFGAYQDTPYVCTGPEKDCGALP